MTELLCKVIHCLANLHGNGKVRKGRGKGDPQRLQFKFRRVVNGRRPHLSIASIRSGDDRVEAVRSFRPSEPWARSSSIVRMLRGQGLVRSREMPHGRDAIFRGFQTVNTAEMRWNADRARKIGANVKRRHASRHSGAATGTAGSAGNIPPVVELLPVDLAAPQWSCHHKSAEIGQSLPKPIHKL